MIHLTEKNWWKDGVFLGHSNNATGPLSFQAQFRLSYWSFGFISEVFFSILEKNTVVSMLVYTIQQQLVNNFMEP